MERATEKLKKKSVISLGGFGGTITVGFHQSIRNSKGEYDFRILGNASYNQNTGTGALGGSAEPGIVLVSKDENGNGLPDDEWYELAGSEYNSPSTIRNYEITYYRPELPGDNVQWTDNQGGQGEIKRNDFTSKDTVSLITMLGVMLFLIVWENRSRYLVNIIPLLLINQLNGIEVCSKIKRRKEE